MSAQDDYLDPDIHLWPEECSECENLQIQIEELQAKVEKLETEIELKADSQIDAEMVKHLHETADATEAALSEARRELMRFTTAVGFAARGQERRNGDA